MDARLFVSTFAVVFLAELPDKTAFAALLLATRKNPLAVFLGAAAAFVIQSAVAVAFGSVIALLPARPVRVVAGLLFLIFAVLMWRQKDNEESGAGAAGPRTESFLRVSFAAFWVIFLAEWGDLTQLATAALAAREKSPWTIFAAATLALWAVSALAIAVGSRAKHLIKTRLLNRAAALAFAAAGAAILLG